MIARDTECDFLLAFCSINIPYIISEI